MIVIDNYSFVCIEKNCMRLARVNEMNDSRRRVAIIGKICDGKQEAKICMIEVQRYEKTYIIGKVNSHNVTYYLGKKSKEMKTFEKLTRENISVITNFSIGYSYYSGKIGKHIPCIVGKVGHGKQKEVILVRSQNFDENTIIDVNGQKYFIDWISMIPWQYQKFLLELRNLPISLKKNFGVFCEKGLKLNMFAMNNYLPILGTAGAFEIK